MSVSASIEIELVGIDITKTIQALLNNGWTFNDNGHKSYLPIGDNDSWDWCWDSLTDEELLYILKKKEELGEIIGVGITWLDTARGGELIFENNKLLIFNLSNNRLVGESSITDFEWYLKRIVGVFDKNEMEVKSIKCYEYK